MQEFSNPCCSPFEEPSKENVLLTDKHVLLCLHPINEDSDLDYIKEHFCGRILDELSELTLIDNVIIYLAGDFKLVHELLNKYKIYVIQRYSYNCDLYPQIITNGQVPINLHNQGVYFRQLFNTYDYFDQITQSHKFQRLTESNKPSNAFRSGIYLSNVIPIETPQ